MTQHYVQAGDVVDVLGQSTEAGLSIGFAGRHLVVEVRAYNDGRLYPTTHRKHSPDSPLTGCSMTEVALYSDGDRWFYIEDDRINERPEWKG
ncbi:hypothetical protein ACQPYK_29345 [Streptosporangium sp. CA-135522]|uniref:hypothetical protein n=1 Tax=Streptosporangium sp. CA-135522 TaxID=3240072 RepID=UPI003D8B484E